MTESDQDDQTGGLLTPPQREYLRGDSDIKSESTHERVTRSRLRDRIYATLSIDFALLGKSLRKDDREQVLDQLDVDVTPSLIEMVAWIHQAAETLGLDSKRVLEEGIERGEARLGNEDVTVEVEIEFHSGVEHLQERFESGDPTLTGSELARLQLETSIGVDEIGEYYGKTLEQGDDSERVSTGIVEEMGESDNGNGKK